MKQRVFIALRTILLSLVVVGIAIADIPRIISYQGHLTTLAGDPVPDGAYQITFAIYADSTGGSPLWTSGSQPVDVAGGLFSYQLGSSAGLSEEIFNAGPDRFLGITVGGDPEIQPRTRLVCSPYSYQSLWSDSANFAAAIADGSVSSASIQNGAVAFEDIGQNGAASGQIMKWSGTAWVAAGDETGGAGSSGWTDDGTAVRLQTTTDSVGIGTTTPTEKLDVDGTIRMTGLEMPTGATEGYVLTSDATGAGTWQAGGTGDITGVTAGPGLTGGGESGDVSLDVEFAGSGSAATVARSDHDHDAAYVNEGQASSINSSMVTNGTLQFADIAQNGASLNQVMKWNGSAWAAANDEQGSGGGWIDDGTVVRLVTAGDSVGIGTLAPSANLHVEGILRVSDKASLGLLTTSSGDWAFASGNRNLASGDYSHVGGGSMDTASGTASAVTGGTGNVAGGYAAFIGGGYEAYASNDACVVLGGSSDTASGVRSAVVGGVGNSATGDYSIVVGGVNNMAIGHSSVSAGYRDSCLADHSVIGGGYRNRILNAATHSVIGGGTTNRIEAYISTIAGGQDNVILGDGNTIGGGIGNTTDGTYSTVAGGSANQALIGPATVGGGSFNDASASGSTISGGSSNTASGDLAAIGGGSVNVASGSYSTIAGGRQNYATADNSSVLGGRVNDATANDATVCGGANHNASGEGSFVGGGRDHIINAFLGGASAGYHQRVGDAAEDSAAYIGGGYANGALAAFSTVGGGFRDTASAYGSTIGGGYHNTATYKFCTVGGGSENHANNYYSTVSGGLNNRASGYGSAVGGGWLNQAGASYSCVPCGYGDTVGSSAMHSMVFGRLVKTEESYRVIFFDSLNDGRFGINRDDDDGGVDYPVHVGTNASNGNGARLTEGGAWTNSSSREFKENFESLDGGAVLDMIDRLQMQSWEYRGTGERHIWPVAEDFVASFDVGTRRHDGSRENQYLAAGDVAGVALVGVQELYRMVRQFHTLARQWQTASDKLAEANRQIELQQAQIAQLQGMVQSLLASSDESQSESATLAEHHEGKR